jgi:uncharacterized protein (UPF0261 family)
MVIQIMKHVKKPRIVCTGILDTKGEEIRFLAEQVAGQGGVVRIMDLSLGKEVTWADISLSEVLSSTGAVRDDVFRASRAEAARIVSLAGARKILELYTEGTVDGIIAWGGAMGTSVATRVMRALPIGVPKVMMSTVASSDVRGWLVHSDIYITNPIAEQGINKITRMIVDMAAASVVAMARARSKSVWSDKPLAAITAYGTTYQTVKRCASFINDRGWESIALHATGNGATMEDLIREGQIQALYDVTTAELSNTRFKSPYGIKEEWDGERLTAAGEAGIPQVVCPGGIDQFTLGPLPTVPERLLDEYRRGLRISHNQDRMPYVHNPNVTTLTPTIEETEEIATYMIEKLNATGGPTVLFIPMRGWSSYDQSGDIASIDRGWPAELGDGPVWWPDPEKPSWSLRATSMWAVVRRYWNARNENLDVICCDMHLLDVGFADLLNRCMGDMIDGLWHRGMYRDIEGVIS